MEHSVRLAGLPMLDSRGSLDQTKSFLTNSDAVSVDSEKYME